MGRTRKRFRRRCNVCHHWHGKRDNRKCPVEPLWFWVERGSSGTGGGAAVYSNDRNDNRSEIPPDGGFSIGKRKGWQAAKEAFRSGHLEVAWHPNGWRQPVRTRCVVPVHLLTAKVEPKRSTVSRDGKVARDCSCRCRLRRRKDHGNVVACCGQPNCSGGQGSGSATNSRHKDVVLSKKAKRAVRTRANQHCARSEGRNESGVAFALQAEGPTDLGTIPRALPFVRCALAAQCHAANERSRRQGKGKRRTVSLDTRECRHGGGERGMPRRYRKRSNKPWRMGKLVRDLPRMRYVKPIIHYQIVRESLTHIGL